ncbi:MAG: carboxymethylenebutenolidase [Phycisphaerales bacterium]|nr:carboxymethylenebutenolidase [Phycisphaerales bacterium]
MKMQSATVSYSHAREEFDGFVARPQSSQDCAPIVIVFHAWAGQDDFAREKAQYLARLGYVGFAADLYGRGRRGTTTEECSALMSPLMQDRALLAQRIEATVSAAKQIDGADATRIAAIGYCFGGLCCFDLARAVVGGVLGVAGFHGLLTPSGLPQPRPIATRVLALHGYDDPMGKPESVLAFAAEMSSAGADWEIVAYGGTQHAFTNPAANDPAFGTVYQARADQRSQARTRDFLRECLGC